MKLNCNRPIIVFAGPPGPAFGRPEDKLHVPAIHGPVGQARGRRSGAGCGRSIRVPLRFARNDANQLRPQRHPGFAYLATPVMSIMTQGLSPTIHASWPGGMKKTSPGPYSTSVPSSILTAILPSMQ